MLRDHGVVEGAQWGELRLSVRSALSPLLSDIKTCSMTLKCTLSKYDIMLHPMLSFANAIMSDKELTYSV